MKKIGSIILGLILVVSIGFNVYLYQGYQQIEKNIAENNVKIEELGNQKSEIEKEIESKDSEIAELEGKIAELEDSKVELENSKTSLEEEIKGYKEEIVKIEEEKERQEQAKAEQAKAKEQTSSDIPEDLGFVSIDDLSEEEIQAICDKWGIEYIGSGLDTSGFDHGDGGHGTIFE